MRTVACALMILLAWAELACAQYPSASPVPSPGAAGPIPGADYPASANPPAPATPATLPQLIPTRQTAFLIPFTVDDAEGLPTEVQLFMSTDRGASWQLVARQRPADGQFRFRASQDGEYWFAPKTIDQWNQVRPSGPPRPELRMLIDTLEPRFQFEAVAGRAGEVQTRWEAQDANLVRGSLRIEYQDAIGSRWRAVALDPPQPGPAALPYSGSVTWVPETTARAVNVRAEIQDQAGNRAVINRRVFLPRNDTTPSVTGVPVRPPTQPPSGFSAGAPVPRDPYDQTPGAANPAPGAFGPAPGAYSRAQGAYGPVPGLGGPAPGAGDLPWSATTAEPAAGSESGGREPGTNPGGADQFATGDQRESAYRPVSVPSNSGLLADRQQPPDSPDPPQRRHYGLPPGERPRLTNSRRFGLEYDVDAVGPQGVASVELWTTTDGGQTWSLWGQDADRVSPFDVEVDAEGIYGFRVVIVGNSGLAGRAPRSGDLADIWVAVDATAPHGRLTSASYGQGVEAGHLLIQWEADDDWLAPRPITLLFSDQLDGPWTTLASGLPNDGRYAWKADPRVPRKIYLRMEVRDEAGNVGTYQLSDPISADGLTPRGRIRGIRPLDSGGQ